jgi:hypothetical protein
MSCGLDVEPGVILREGHKQKENMNIKKLQLLLVVASLVFAGAARAQIYTLHDGESGPLDFVAVQVVSGNNLDTPAPFQYDPDGSSMALHGWTVQGNETSAYATFANANSLDFDVALMGTFQTANANLMLYGFNGDTQVFRETMVMGPNDPNNGGGNSAWGGEYLPTDSTTREELINAVPEPTTLALAGMGGLFLLLFRRQQK